MPVKQIEYAQCKVCGYEWIPQAGRIPTTCANPKCRSKFWNEGPQRPSMREQREAAAVRKTEEAVEHLLSLGYTVTAPNEAPHTVTARHPEHPTPEQQSIEEEAADMMESVFGTPKKNNPAKTDVPASGRRK